MLETPNRTYRFLLSTFELIFVLHIFETFWKVMISNIRTIFKPLTSNELISSSVTKKQQSRPSSSSVMHPRNQFPFIGRPVRFFSNLAWHLHDKANIRRMWPNHSKGRKKITLFRRQLLTPSTRYLAINCLGNAFTKYNQFWYQKEIVSVVHEKELWIRALYISLWYTNKWWIYAYFRNSCD